MLAEDSGSQVELTLDTDLIVNDPQYIYGASRIMGLDLTDVSHAILQTLNLNNCTALRTLDVSPDTDDAERPAGERLQEPAHAEHDRIEVHSLYRHRPE